MLNKNHHGKSYAYEIAHSFNNYLFSEINTRSIYAYIEDYNTTSHTVLRKISIKKKDIIP